MATSPRFKSVFACGLLVLGGGLAVFGGGLAAQVTIPLDLPELTSRSLTTRGDSLLSAGDPTGAYSAFLSSPGQISSRERAIRVAVRMSVVADTHDERRSWSLAADSVGRQLLGLLPGDPDALAWAAAARGRVAANQEGLRAPARTAREAWDLAEQVVGSAPDHPLANHVRGQIVHALADLSGPARWFLGLFLDAPEVGDASWGAAISFHRRAVAGTPDEIMFHMGLGSTLVESGASAEGEEVWRAALDLPERDAIDGLVKSRIRERLSELSSQSAPSSGATPSAHLDS